MCRGPGSSLTGLHCAHASSSGMESQGPYTALTPDPSSELPGGGENTKVHPVLDLTRKIKKISSFLWSAAQNHVSAPDMWMMLKQTELQQTW